MGKPTKGTNVSSYDYEHLIADIHDYPKKGVVFRDITPMLSDPAAFATAIDTISDHFMGRGITKVMGSEARGFFVGAPIAYRLNAGFVPARKPGKLPRETYDQDYDLEYGSASLHIHKDALTPEDHVLIVDDLVATSGTGIACGRLVEQAGATIEGFAFLVELGYLNPREAIAEHFNQEVFTLVKYD